MKSKGNKDLAIVYIMDILASYTDPDHPMLYQEIEEILRDEYGIDLERRTVAAKINLLIESGLIERKGLKSGAYFDNREFLNEELDLLIYSVMANRNLPQSQVRDLADRIGDLGGRHFKPMIGTGRSMLMESRSAAEGSYDGGNQEIFMNLEDINRAIRSSNQITFDYCRYGLDKKLHIDSTHTASPYYVIMKDQKLWLAAYSETHGTVSFFRIDRIKNVSIRRKKSVDIRSVHGYEMGLDAEYLKSALPYMYSDRPERITFKADKAIVDQIVDWFGNAVKLKRDKTDSSKVIATIRTSPMAMEYWAKQYIDHVEIIEPLSLRVKIRESLESGVARYTDSDK